MSSEDVSTDTIKIEPGSVTAASFDVPPEKSSWGLQAAIIAAVIAFAGMFGVYAATMNNRIEAQLERIKSDTQTIETLIRENAELRESAERQCIDGQPRDIEMLDGDKLITARVCVID